MKFKVSLVCFVFCIVVWNQICDAKRYGGGGSLSRGSNRGSSRRTGTNYGGVSKNRPAQTSTGQLSHTNLASLSYAGYNQRPAPKPQPKPSAPELPKHSAPAPAPAPQPNPANSRPVGWNVDGANHPAPQPGFKPEATATRQNAGSLNSQNAQPHGLPQQPPPYGSIAGHNPAQGVPQGPPPPYSQHPSGGANPYGGQYPPAYSPNQQSGIGHQPAVNQGYQPGVHQPGYQGGYPNQHYPAGGVNQPGYPNQGYHPNPGYQPGYHNQGYQPGYPNQGYHGGYQPGYQGYPNSGLGGFGGYGGYGGYGYPQRSSGSSFLGFGSGLGIGSIVTGLALWSFARSHNSQNVVHVYDSRTGEASNITSLTHPCIADIVNGTNATSVTVILAPNCTFVSQDMQGANNFTIDTAAAQKEILQNGTESLDLNQIGLAGYNLTGVNLTEALGNDTNLLHLNTQFNQTGLPPGGIPPGMFLPAATELTNVEGAPKDINTMPLNPAFGVHPISENNAENVSNGGGKLLAEAGGTSQAQLATSGGFSVFTKDLNISLLGVLVFIFYYNVEV